MFNVCDVANMTHTIASAVDEEHEELFPYNSNLWNQVIVSNNIYTSSKKNCATL